MTGTKLKIIYMHFLPLRVIHNKREVDRCSVARYVLCNSYMFINITVILTLDVQPKLMANVKK